MAFFFFKKKPSHDGLGHGEKTVAQGQRNLKLSSGVPINCRTTVAEINASVRENDFG
jgi:hypothetical protein